MGEALRINSSCISRLGELHAFAEAHRVDRASGDLAAQGSQRRRPEGLDPDYPGLRAESAGLCRRLANAPSGLPRTKCTWTCLLHHFRLEAPCCPGPTKSIQPKLRGEPLSPGPGRPPSGFPCRPVLCEGHTPPPRSQEPSPNLDPAPAQELLSHLPPSHCSVHLGVPLPPFPASCPAKATPGGTLFPW